MKGLPLVSAALFVLPWAAAPARARTLKAAPPGSTSLLAPEVTAHEEAELKALMSSAGSLLEELHAWSLEEAKAEDLAVVIPGRDRTLYRYWTITGELSKGQKRLGARIRRAWLVKATLLAKATKAGKKADVDSGLDSLVKSEDLDREIGEFWKKARKVLAEEEESFARAKARVQAREQQRALVRFTCAGAGAAALLILGVALIRRRLSTARYRGRSPSDT